MEFKNIQEKVAFLKKQEELVESLKKSPSKLDMEKVLLRYLAPACSFSIVTFFLFNELSFSLSFGFSFFVANVFLESHKLKQKDLNKLMTSFPIKGVTSIDEYKEKLSAISFRAVADENHQVAKELLEHLTEEERYRIANKKKYPPLKIIESEE